MKMQKLNLDVKKALKEFIYKNIKSFTWVHQSDTPIECILFFSIRNKDFDIRMRNSYFKDWLFNSGYEYSLFINGEQIKIKNSIKRYLFNYAIREWKKISIDNDSDSFIMLNRFMSNTTKNI